ncbi:MAG: TonB-dependent receptor [Bryobacterales bacterium]|nr:TonB-dependent receptor [Bryobacterales bacterium]MBV9397790.1 TonB-dependent receptor [Bryobacterales bacterium]
MKLAALVVLCSVAVVAQTAGLRGVVTDESGAAVPGAEVTLNGPRGLVKMAQSGADGSYSFTGLGDGDYTVSASAPSLIAPPAKITLRVGVSILNLQLRIVTSRQQVTVNDEAAPTVSTDAANNAGAVVLRGDDLQALSDDPDDLAADLQALAGPSAGPGGGSIFIDGFSSGALPPKDSIREIRINQNPFSPEYDKLGLGRIEILTKPGSNQFHGTLSYNRGDDAWNGRNPYAAQKATLQLNEFENSISGRLSHRSSFTLDLDRQLVDNGSIVNGVILNPNTLAVEAFTDTVTAVQRRWMISPRIDYQLNDANTLTVRYSFVHTNVGDAGIGGFNLESRGDRRLNTYNTAQFIETSVHGPMVNETRFQYYRWSNDILANNLAPALQVLGAFNSGGNPAGHSTDLQNNYELQNYTTVIHRTHNWRFGVRLRAQTDDNVSPQNFLGTFTFSGALAPVLDASNQPVPGPDGQPVLTQIQAIEQYRRTLLFQGLGYSPALIRQLGGGASQFTLSSGNPAISAHQIDAGLFVNDDWRARPNLTISLGARYEAQTNISDRSDIAPRIGIAWAPGASGNRQPKTVLRFGFGMFYDRFALANTIAAERYNGITEQQYVISDPNFYPTAPDITALGATVAPQQIQLIDSHLRAPYVMQSAATLERQLPKNTALSITYTNSHALHVLRSLDINAPLPGTVIAGRPGTGVFPFGAPDSYFLMTSSGLYNQNQLIVNVNTKLNSQVSLSSSYTLNRARSNSDGLGTFPANPYDFTGEYGPAANDIHHRMQITGSINTRWNLRFSPNITLQSGPPFDITTGTDLYGTTLYNARPGLAGDPTKAGVIQTPYGLLDPNPVPGQPLLPRNYGRGPGTIMVNLRVGKTFAFGPERGGSTAPKASGIFASPGPDRRFNVTISMAVRNLINHTNPGPIIGNIASPLFGQANQMAGGPNGEGFSENANNRRLELQTRFTF